MYESGLHFQSHPAVCVNMQSSLLIPGKSLRKKPACNEKLVDQDI